MERVYNKLVRDRIPEIIRKQGKEPVTRILEQDEYLRCLDGKLREELEEYLEDGSLEELCDVLEVLYAILGAKGITREEAERVRAEKADSNGGFRERIYLQKVVDE